VLQDFGIPPSVVLIALIAAAAALVMSFCRRERELLPNCFQSWNNAYGRPTPPQFWLLFQACEREQLRGKIDACFLTR
jgi:hypothetical protein